MIAPDAASAVEGDAVRHRHPDTYTAIGHGGAHATAQPATSDPSGATIGR